MGTLFGREGRCGTGSMTRSGGPRDRSSRPIQRRCGASHRQTGPYRPGPPLTFAERCPKGLRQLEINRDQSLGFDGPSVDQVGLVTPLPDGAIRCLSQKERAAN